MLLNRSLPLTILIVAEIIIIAILGSITIKKTRVWSLGDEKAHFGVIQYIAEKRALPVYLRSQISEEAIAIDHGTYPHPAARSDWEVINGANAIIAEAFQPPAYYLLAVPFYLASENHLDKVYWLRLFNLLLYFCFIGVVWAIAGEVSGKSQDSRARLFAFSLLTFVIPTVMVRALTISNVALEGVMIAVSIFFLIRFHKTGKFIQGLRAGLSVGLAILTKMTSLYLLPIYLIVLSRKFRSKELTLTNRNVALAVLPMLPISPWIVFNLKNYGSLTPNLLARDYVLSFNDRHFSNFGLPAVLRLAKDQFFSFLPAEWLRVPLRLPAPEFTTFLFTMIFVVPVVLFVVRFAAERKLRGEQKRSLGSGIIFSGYLSLVALLNSIIYFTNMPLEGRFLFPTWSIWAVLVAHLYEQLSLKLFWFLMICFGGALTGLWWPAWTATVW